MPTPSLNPAPETLVIGAGPAGLACAMELSRKGKSCSVIERDHQVGGLAQTIKFEEGDDTFLTDIGPHRFFSKNQYLYDFIEDLLKEEWRRVPRLTRQFVDGKYYNYPVNFGQVVGNLGILKSAKIGIDYFLARLRYDVFKKPLRTFEDYVVANFGRALAEFSMINYSEKIWGIPCADIHPDWAKQRISGLNLWSVLKNAIGLGSKAGPKSLVDEFYYPQYGTGRIYEEIAKHLKKSGTEISVNSEPVAIRHDGKRISEVDIRTPDGTIETIKPQNVVESVPLTAFLNLLDPKPPEEVTAAAKNLRWRNQVYLFLTLNKDQVTADNWIYFPQKDIPFGRTSEMKNFSKDMCPEGTTSFFIEFFTFAEDDIWTMPKEQLLAMVLPYFEKWGFFTKDDIRQSYLMKRSHVYPVYDTTYKTNVEKIRDYLDGIENLIYVGRPGRFRYTNQDHSLEMGIIASRMILEGRHYDMDTVGAENEYFEKGPIYEKRI